MNKLEFEDRVIYRAKKGFKVRFVNSNELYEEIVLTKNDTRQVEEVKVEE